MAHDGMNPEDGRIEYRGLALPVVKSQGGYFASKTLHDLLWSSIVMILLTPKNFRVMLPEFGGGLSHQLFEFLPVAQTAVKEAVIKEVPKWDPRLSVDFVDVRTLEEENKIAVFVTYRVVGQQGQFTKRLVVDMKTLGGIIG